MIIIATVPRASAFASSIASQVRSFGLDCVQHEVTSFDQVADLDQAEVILSFLVPVGTAELARMPRLRGIVSPLLGFDWIDVAAATARGVAVVNGQVAENREGMAEATILLLLALLYRLHDTEAQLRNNVGADRVQRHILRSRTIGIIGFGGITRAVLDRLAGWGGTFLIASRAMPEEIPGVSFVAIDELLERSDVILVLTGLNASTRHMLSTAQFAKVKPGTLLVNTARGAIIDQAALIEALESGQIGAAALDVFEEEPLAAVHPLRELPNVILTQHCIGHNEEAKAAGPRVAAENIRLLAKGSLPESCRNPEVATAFAQANMIPAEGRSR